MNSLRQFSARRVAAFMLMDWLSTLALLYVTPWLSMWASRLSDPRSGWLSMLLPVESAGGMAGQFAFPSLPILVLTAVIWPVSLYAFSVYDGRRNSSLRAEIAHILPAIGVSTLVLAGALHLTYREFPRAILVSFLLLDAAVLLGSRVSLWGFRRTSVGQRRALRRKVVVVGAGPVGQRVVRQLTKYGWANLELAGYADDDPAKQGQLLAGRPVLGTLEQMPTLVETCGIQDAVVALPLRAHDRMVAVCNTLQQLGVRVHVVPDLFSLSFPDATLDGFGGIPVVALGQQGIRGWRRFRKRVFDAVVALTVLVVLSPLALLIAILIKLDSPGPVIFRQERIGENGRPFIMHKFRSMRQGADTGTHRSYVTELIQRNLGPEQHGQGGHRTLKNTQDPRVTRVGKFLRKTSLDELPQLVNVLRGDMSLVGPRPPLAYEVAVYKDWHKRRLEALPGITGLWQVEGRNQVSFDEMVRLDLKYIENQSLWHDIRILLLTPWAVLTGRGAG